MDFVQYPTVRSGVGGDGCEVDVTAELEVALEVAKTGGGNKSARGGGVLKRVSLMVISMLTLYWLQWS